MVTLHYLFWRCLQGILQGHLAIFARHSGSNMEFSRREKGLKFACGNTDNTSPSIF